MRRDRICGCFGETSYIKCSQSVTPIAKGDVFHLNQCLKNDFESLQILDIPYASILKSLATLCLN